MPGLVPTARELQDHYMSGGGSSITIDSQAFYNSYGRFAPLVGAAGFKDVLKLKYGDDINNVPLDVPIDFSANINHLITDIHSADYLNRALGYGVQTYIYKALVTEVNGERRINLELQAPKKEDYNFIGDTGADQKNANSQIEALRKITGFLLDPLQDGQTFFV